MNKEIKKKKKKLLQRNLKKGELASFAKILGIGLLIAPTNQKGKTSSKLTKDPMDTMDPMHTKDSSPTKDQMPISKKGLTTLGTRNPPISRDPNKMDPLLLKENKIAIATSAGSRDIGSPNVL